MSQPPLEQPPLFPEQAPGIEPMQHELLAFVHNPNLERLAVLTETAAPLPTEPRERLAALQTIARDHLDFRGGKARQNTQWEGRVNTEVDELLTNVGEALGMDANTAPEHRYPDWLLLPGAANEAALNRLAIGLTTVQPKAMAALASARRLSPTEQERVATWAPGAETEFDLSCAAYESMPGAQLIGETAEDREGDTWRIRLYKVPLDNGRACEAYVIGAPAMVQDGKGGLRPANSHDNFRCFADGVGVRPGMRVAVATTGIYVPMQHLAAVEELAPSGYRVETFGHSGAFSRVPIKRTGPQYGQEIKSAIDAAASLQSAIDRGGAETVFPNA